MTIINRVNTLTKKEIYNMSKNPEIKKMSNIIGETINVVAHLEFIDETEKGEHKVLTLLTDDGEVFATDSITFCKSFYEVLEIFIDDKTNKYELQIGVIDGNSKNGRTYINCVYRGV